MIEHYSLQKLRDLSVVEVAERLGLYVSHGKCLCPFHDDSHPSLMFRKGKNSFRCFVCGAGGSGPIDLVMKVLNKSFPEACQWLAEERNVILEQQKSYRAKAVGKGKGPCERFDSSIDLPHLESLIRYPVLNDEAQHFLFDERKISPSVIDHLGISSISQPVPMSRNLRCGFFNAPSLLIPYRDADGKLISVQARYLGSDKSKPRFQFPKGCVCSIYNLSVLPTLGDGEPLFITEGCTDCLAMLSSGRKAIAIPSATLLKPADITVLRSFIGSDSTRLHICPDRDRPGEQLYIDLKKLFPWLVRHQLPEGYKDFGEWWANKC